MNAQAKAQKKALPKRHWSGAASRTAGVLPIHASLRGSAGPVLLLADSNGTRRDSNPILERAQTRFQFDTYRTPRWNFNFRFTLANSCPLKTASRQLKAEM